MNKSVWKSSLYSPLTQNNRFSCQSTPILWLLQVNFIHNAPKGRIATSTTTAAEPTLGIGEAAILHPLRTRCPLQISNCICSHVHFSRLSPTLDIPFITTSNAPNPRWIMNSVRKRRLLESGPQTREDPALARVGFSRSSSPASAAFVASAQATREPAEKRRQRRPPAGQTIQQPPPERGSRGNYRRRRHGNLATFCFRVLKLRRFRFRSWRWKAETTAKRENAERWASSYSHGVVALLILWIRYRGR